MDSVVLYLFIYTRVRGGQPQMAVGCPHIALLGSEFRASLLLFLFLLLLLFAIGLL